MLFRSLGTAQGNPWLTAVFSQRWLCFLGEVGFSWYLLHMGVFQCVNAAGPASPVLRFALAFAGCCVVSWLGFHGVEAPAMRWGHRRLQRSRPEKAGESGGTERRRLAA